MNVLPLEINLLQREEKRPSVGGPLFALAVLLAGSVLVGWLWNDANTRVRELRAELESVDAKIAGIEALRAQSGSSAPAQGWAELTDALRAAMPEATAVLDGLGELLPVEANLASVVYTEDGRLKVSARFASVEHVIQFMRSVRASGRFELLDMSGLTNELPGSGGAPDDEPDDEEESTDAASRAAPAEKTMPVVSVTFDLRYVRSSPEREGAGS